ncbi:C40 family peptidase [Neobacillus sp. PS3-34]|uniref:C40 family peptidase n=1 Tax=Neobacillus sp. PS3-34 TaxID=3070678 RepID=UPI0027E0F0B7|nr:C40 family peptidase [Neobacillus sp. PS3-34]WML48851.1 C40 family peptidase [Neobacillus sp. PS3-34]
MIRGLHLSKRIISALSLFALAVAFLFSSSLHKAEASVSWGQEVTEVGKLYLGNPYKWGGTSQKGFDASGYTQYIFKTSAAKMTLPPSSKEQYKLGKAVKQKDLKEGDLVFFNIDGKGVSFVGIYLNSNQFLAVTVNKGVSIQSLSSKYWKDRYIGAKRVLKEY